MQTLFMRFLINVKLPLELDVWKDGWNNLYKKGKKYSQDLIKFSIW